MTEYVCIVLTGDPDFIRDRVQRLYPCLWDTIELEGLRSEESPHVLRVTSEGNALQDAVCSAPEVACHDMTP